MSTSALTSRSAAAGLDISAARRLGASLPTDGSVIPSAMIDATLDAPAAQPSVSPGEFGQMLNRQRDYAAATSRQGLGESQASVEDRARQAAEDFVSQAFVQPLLKELRESNDAWGPFAPGTGEKQMRSLADAQMARNLVKASNWPLIDQIKRSVMRQAPDAMPGSPADLRQRTSASLAQHSALNPQERGR